jgi:MoxR-like ATPase
LPEAQLDRFMFNIVIDYPSAEEERRILSATTGSAQPRVTPVADGDEIERMHALVRDVPAAENVVEYATRLVRASRPAFAAVDSSRGDGAASPGGGVFDYVQRWVRWGAGPRAGQALLLGAKARALIEGRCVAAPEDVTAVALPVLRHRILVNFQAEADAIDADAIVGRLLGDVRP